MAMNNKSTFLRLLTPCGINDK